MPFEILVAIGAFLIGIVFDYYQVWKKTNNYSERANIFRSLLYKTTVVYFLFKIGFVGGSEVMNQPWQMIIVSGTIVVIVASFWTIFVLFLLNRWSSLNSITKISIATHFGSVSVGTFIVAMAFLDSKGIAINPVLAIWLVLMEFPAVLIGMRKLGIRANMIISILKAELLLVVLPVSIVLGIFLGKYVPLNISSVVFGVLFMPMLIYFLFEMGRQASSSLVKLKGEISSVFFIGIAIPILGGFFGTSIGYWIGYDMGSIFTLAILTASASYVLAPLCMKEVLKNFREPAIAKQAVAVSMALSVGITLPFNILIGFELYYAMIQWMKASPVLAFFALVSPFIIVGISLLRRSKQSIN